MSNSSSENDDQVMTDTPPTPELNLSFDTEDRPGFIDEESGSKPKSVGFAQTTAAPAHPLAISSVEVDAASSPGHRRDVSELGVSENLTGRLTVGSSILTSPDTAVHLQSLDSNVVEKTEHIRGKHVRNVFRGSVTVGTVNYEQIQRIKKMHDSISENAEFNFNYICLLIVASIVAGLGLMTNSSTTVISSMLLSPIMGPVIGMSYGLVIWDIDLIKKSAKVELISILICIFFGCILTLCTSWTELADGWATDEMTARGTKQTFLTGIPIAFFSGIGVALGLLDESTSSLVGVAISASLLPPAVNCGILFIFAAQIRFNENNALSRDREFNNDEDPFVTMGIMSLSLTAANILVVWLAAALMFRLKEVLPVKKKIFWEDLKHARRIYQKRAILEDDGRGAISVRRLHGPGVVTGAVKGVKEKVISPIARRVSDQNDEDFENENESGDVPKADNIAAN